MKRTREDRGYRFQTSKDKGRKRPRRDESVGKYRALRSRLRDEVDE